MPTSLIANDKTIKRMIYIAWNERLYREGTRLALEMLAKAGIADGSRVMRSFKISSLHTATPQMEDIAFERP